MSLLCSLYNNIKAPSQLQPSATYYLFKDGIEPKWEDPKNTHGGSWTCNAPRTPNGKGVLDAWWLHAVSPNLAQVHRSSRAGRIRRRVFAIRALEDRLQTGLCRMAYVEVYAI